MSEWPTNWPNSGKAAERLDERIGLKSSVERRHRGTLAGLRGVSRQGAGIVGFQFTFDHGPFSALHWMEKRQSRDSAN